MQGDAHPVLCLSSALDVPEEQADAIENAGRYLVGADQRIVGIVKTAVNELPLTYVSGFAESLPCF